LSGSGERKKINEIKKNSIADSEPASAVSRDWVDKGKIIWMTARLVVQQPKQTFMFYFLERQQNIYDLGIGIVRAQEL
jgi:hypothetical protein